MRHSTYASARSRNYVLDDARQACTIQHGLVIRKFNGSEIALQCVIQVLSVISQRVCFRSLRSSIDVLLASIEIPLDHRGVGLLVLSVCTVCNSRRSNLADCADEHSSRYPIDWIPRIKKCIESTQRSENRAWESYSRRILKIK